MYYFTLGGKDCRCDTADELRAICEEPRELFAAKEPTHSAYQDEEMATAIPTVSTAIPKATKRKAKRTKKQEASVTHRIGDLPYVEGGLSWSKVRKIAKQLKRKDVRQLRSDLYKRQQMGE